MTVLLLIYKYAFQNSLGGDYGMAAALSLMLAAFLAVFTAGYYWLTRRWSRLMTLLGRRDAKAARPTRRSAGLFRAPTAASAASAGVRGAAREHARCSC